MPSGAKKRKAAKKKKESEVKGTSHLPNSTSLLVSHSHGEENLKHQDDKDSDGGEVSSPASQDNRNRDQFIEGEEEEADKREVSLLDPSSGVTSEGEQMEKKGIVEEESVTHVEREVKALDGPQEGGSLKSSISSSSCLDDESEAADKNKIVEANYPTVVVNELDSLSADKVTDIIPETETRNSDVGAVTSDEMIRVGKNAYDNNSVTSYAVLSELMKNEKKKLGVDEKSASVSEVLVDVVSPTKEHEAVQTSRDTVVETLHGKDSANQGNGLKDSEVPQCSDSQPPVGSALQPVQTTSWKGCCGLFELFTGSSR